jgi:molybdopterin/thiamine biosynthesis adenylyltransferase
MEKPAEDADLVLVVPDTEHDRYATFGFLGWWDQRRMAEAVVLVAGAGALGNEVLKNLALAGVGRLLIVDFDTVEASNLSRAVLFRDGDRGRSKGAVAAAAVRRINPDVRVCAIAGDLTRVLGGGVFRHVDAVVGCVDNREARLFLNRACFRVGKPWVDGAIHEMLGEARVFWPGRGGCYECTLVAADYQAMNRRYSCSSLARDLALAGKIATTPTIASIIGGIEAQEVLKLLQGVEVDPGKGLVFNGLTNEAYSVTFPCHAGCLSHPSCGPIEECADLRAASTTLGEMLAHVRRRLGEPALLELDFDLLIDFECVHGHPSLPVLRPVTQVAESAALCPVCGSARWPRQVHSLRGSEPFQERTLAELGIAPLSLLRGRVPGGETRYFELTGDHSRIFDFHPSGEE